MAKKRFSVLISALLCVALSISAFSAAPAEVEKIRMGSSPINMVVGDTTKIKVWFTPSKSSDTLTWSSGDEDVATVDNTGTVTAVGVGTATIRAETSGGLYANCQVKVRKPGTKVAARSMTMNLESMTVRINQTRLLWVEITPSDATDKDQIEWSSSDRDVASVNDGGVVTGVGPGTAVITATAYNSSATCLVTVPGKVVKGIADGVENTRRDNSGEVLTAAAAKTEVEIVAKKTAKNATGTATFNNKSSVSPTVIGAAAYTAEMNDRHVLLKFTTTDTDGKVQGSITIDPQKAKELTTDIKPGVYTSSKEVSSVRSLFAKYFQNQVAVIHCAQSGGFGLEVKLAAKLNLSGMNTDNLRFYTYNSASNSCAVLDVASYVIDKNGYLQFSTSTGGIIIVTDSELTK